MTIPPHQKSNSAVSESEGFAVELKALIMRVEKILKAEAVDEFRLAIAYAVNDVEIRQKTKDGKSALHLSIQRWSEPRRLSKTF